MPDPMSHDRREEIRAALEPLPPYPWRWGSAWKLETGDTRPRPVLTTGIASEAPDFLFLSFEESGDDEGWYLRSAEEIAELGRSNPVANWIEHGAQYAEELLFDNEQLGRKLAEADSRLRVADERERAHLDRIAQLEERLDTQTTRAITAEHHAKGVESALGRAKQDAGELEQLAAEAYVEPAGQPVDSDQIRVLAEYFVRQAAGCVEFQDILDDLGDRPEFQALGVGEFDNAARAIHDLATGASVTVHLPKGN